MKENIYLINKSFSEKTPEELVYFFLKKYTGRIAMASSLGLEDQVLTDMILRIDSKCPIFSIDTGRLFPETYSLIDTTNRAYNIELNLFFPKNESIKAYIKEYGINGFYESIDGRKECCRIRKIEPLSRALSGLKVWICGLRKEQSVSRMATKLIGWDEFNQLIKINPLADWTEQQVWNYIKLNKVPYNELHEVGFPSVGCQPCTRSVKKGGNLRSGRWWWENLKHKECGLH